MRAGLFTAACWALTASALATCGCAQRSRPEREEAARRALPTLSPSARPATRESAAGTTEATPRKEASNARQIPRGDVSPSIPSAVPLPIEARSDAGTSQGPFVVDDLVDVAPAGPATAHTLGVVLVDKNNVLRIARRGPLANGAAPATSPVASLDLPREAFAPYGRGPAVALEHAYWVQQNRLLRRRLDGVGELEVLAEDARRSTRVAATGTRATGALVAYVTTPRPSGPEADAVSAARARVWIEGGKIHDVTPDGAGTSSVALVPQPNGAMLLSLDGRSGMTPLHARRLRVQNEKLLLGPDVVAWVGASAQSTTEVIGAARAGDVWALVAIERDVLHFGVAQIHIGAEPRLDVPASFVTFPNGANTSPIAAAEFCGTTAVVFAQPASAAPGSPQELVLAELGPDGLTRGEIIVRSKAFADASLAPVTGGALLCYTADHRTWAATVRCRR